MMKRGLLLLFLLCLPFTGVYAEEDDRHFRATLLYGAGYEETKNQILSPLIYAGRTTDRYANIAYAGETISVQVAYASTKGTLRSSKTEKLGTKMAADVKRGYLSGAYSVYHRNGLTLYAGPLVDVFLAKYTLSSRMPNASNYCFTHMDISLAPSLYLAWYPFSKTSIFGQLYVPVVSYSYHPGWRNLQKNSDPLNNSNDFGDLFSRSTIAECRRLYLDTVVSYKLFSYLDASAGFLFSAEHGKFSENVTTIDFRFLAGLTFAI
jgi:hypothetical protein